MLTVTKIFEFEAAHRLPNYEGDCHNMHGHTYKLEVTVNGMVDQKQGMIIDFKKLKKIVQIRVLSYMDHQVLNDHVENPTAENLIAFIVSQLLVPFKSEGCALAKVRLWETSNSYCEWTS